MTIMLSSPLDPSPFVQTAVYMGGILSGYALLTTRREWERAWERVRSIWERHRR